MTVCLVSVAFDPNALVIRLAAAHFARSRDAQSACRPCFLASAIPRLVKVLPHHDLPEIL